MVNKMNTDNLLLSDEELIQLTDCKKSSSQIEQLYRLGIKFLIGKTGKPKVSRRYIEEFMGANSLIKSPKQRKGTNTPNEDALKEFLRSSHQ